MLTLTKIFDFEMAHAIYGYSGACKNIHGHSYKLQVTVSSVNENKGFIPAPGFIIDFKDIKNEVNTYIVDQLDHMLVLSKDYLQANPQLTHLENLIIWDFEPSAENILLYILETLEKHLPQHVKLKRLK